MSTPLKQSKPNLRIGQRELADDSSFSSPLISKGRMALSEYRDTSFV